MTGKVSKISRDKSFAFIKTSGGDYFMHKESFDGDWNVLVDDSHSYDVELEFEPVRSSKGLRAEEVSRVE